MGSNRAYRGSLLIAPKSTILYTDWALNILRSNRPIITLKIFYNTSHAEIFLTYKKHL